MSSATLDDVSIHYEVHGDGPPLVLAHCLGGNLELWRDQIPALAARHRLVLWDCRGHGGSSTPPARAQYGVRRSAADLAALLDHVGIARAHIGGLSMGGGISACFAVLYPERVDHLLIMDSNTAAGLPTAPAVRTEREAWAALCERGNREAAVDRFLAANPAYRLFAADSNAMRARVRAMIRTADPIGFAHTIRALLDSDMPVDAVPAIQAPTLVLAGEHDPALAAVRVTHERIAGSRLVLLPGAGHLSNLDSPRAFEAELLAFLAN
jgi:pimeloyl-ACP methyl ester carboxylesterase